MKIYLVRHAAYHNPDSLYAFHLPVYLSPEGREHVHRIGEWFKKQNIMNIPIISSPIVRCVQTSEIISSHIKSNVTLDERLVEVANPTLQGKRMAPDHWTVEDTHPDTETHEDVRARMFNWFDEVIADGKDVIGVSHGTPLTVLYNTLMKEPIPRPLWSPQQAPKNIQRGEVVIITIEDGKFKNAERINV